MKLPSSIIVTLIAFAGISLGKEAKQLDLTCQVAHPLILAGKKQSTYVKVGLTGFEREAEGDRSPVNIALVLDRSGSMRGDKIRYAKDAAKMAVRMMRPEDIFSVVAYDSTVEVLVPATKLTDRKAVIKAIDDLKADGSTALFGGVSKGVAELRKFLSKERVNGVVLLSDGIANVGPQSPSELAELGRSLLKEGISVSTLGLGLDYNEDLMMKLAEASDGIHRFIQEPQQLAHFFEQEFGNVMAVVAQQVDIEIKCAPNIRPVRVLGRQADIEGQFVRLKWNQIYSKEEKYVLLEVEAPVGAQGDTLHVASVNVSYANLDSGERDQLVSKASAQYTDDAEVVQRAKDADVMVAAITQISTDMNEKAMLLRDEGKVEEAKNLLLYNGTYLDANRALYDAPVLTQLDGLNDIGIQNIDSEKWETQRKQMRAEQNFYRSAQNSAESSQSAEWTDRALEALKKGLETEAKQRKATKKATP